jgi:hypothetical protein
MKKLTLRELEMLTGKHHKFLRELLQHVPFIRGPNRSHLYESTRALPAIYAGARSLEEARIKQAEAAARLNEIRAEELAKKRIPIDIVIDTLDETMQAMSAALKNFKGKVLTIEMINDIFADFRAIPDKLNWR